MTVCRMATYKTKKPLKIKGFSVVLAETEGFEPSIQVYARMLP